MAKNKRYKFNPETLAYELHKIPIRARFSRGFVLFLLSLVASLIYYYIFTLYFGFETPKKLALKREEGELINKLELLSNRFREANKTLLVLQMRDNYVYRPIFGMEEISSEVRNAGFGGVNRYSYLEALDPNGVLAKSVINMDVLYKKTFIQSKSFDDVFQLAKNADEMSFCVPAISPVNITARRIRFSSSFGYRPDPFTGSYRMHTGIDLSGPVGEPIYATGNGRVVEIGHDFYGYGNFVLIDHGFGYKTRYAHLKMSMVMVGKPIRRGEQIGLMGNTGRSRGPHLHYEVIYRNRPVNPVNYFSRDIEAEDFNKFISQN
ncbi:MAG: M23 family metallopeptidase [Bacteroidales bacterium]|jgi:murein DD-endopeptidase MepM/ murein hydrolase activator NlpD